jgi:antitoxin component YwqK of YwqJK toxin-antitoxin module
MKKEYANGQKAFEQDGDLLTYFYKNGRIKARGDSIDGVMQGEWIFYRETGQLWQIANFKNNQKHGSWIRYDRKDQIEYNETFENGKLLKKK